jgi:UrcA family protein
MTLTSTQTSTRIAVRSACAIAFAAVGAILAPPALAERQDFSIVFTYDRDQPVETNYRRFVRQAERACLVSSVGPLLERRRDQACVDDLMDKLVSRMGRYQLALTHLQMTGRSVLDTRSLAAR